MYDSGVCLHLVVSGCCVGGGSSSDSAGDSSAQGVGNVVCGRRDCVRSTLVRYVCLSAYVCLSVCMYVLYVCMYVCLYVCTYAGM